MGMQSRILLGHVVSEKGLEVDVDKVKAIIGLGAPACMKEIKRFLRCVGYYRRFN